MNIQEMENIMENLHDIIEKQIIREDMLAVFLIAASVVTGIIII